MKSADFTLQIAEEIVLNSYLFMKYETDLNFFKNKYILLNIHGGKYETEKNVYFAICRAI